MFPQFRQEDPTRSQSIFHFYAATSILVAIILAATAWAQAPASPASAKLTFDVASVKVNKSGGPGLSNVPLGPGDAYALPTGGLFFGE